MRGSTPQIGSLKRTLALLDAVIADGGQNSVSELARRTGLPVATAHRQVTTLVAEGFLRPSAPGRHVAGPRLLRLLHILDEKQIAANVAAPLLHRLATRLRCVVQLGTFENDMVTYRIKTGRGAHDLFTKVGMQLEGYCTGIGKALLAHLPEAEREAYLAGAPFPAFTRHTITDPDQLRAALSQVVAQGFAIDDQEAAIGLRCMAVPLRNGAERVIAAISVSQSLSARHRWDDTALFAMLSDTARSIETAAFQQDR